MNGITKDGQYELTTIEQEGSLAGEEAGRVWVLHRNTKGASRSRWIGGMTVAESREVVAKANSQTAEEFDAWYELKNTGANVHVTAIRDGGVYGHPDNQCDANCAAGTELFFSQVDTGDVEVGNIYGIDEAGKVLYQIET